MLLRARSQGFSSTTMRVIPFYFCKNNNNKIEPKEIPSFFLLTLLKVLTQKLAIIETALYVPVVSFLSQKLQFVMSQMMMN